jgi:hypothetical protein
MPDAVHATCRDCRRDVYVSAPLAVLVWSLRPGVNALRRVTFTFPCCGRAGWLTVNRAEAGALYDAGARTAVEAGEEFAEMVVAYLAAYSGGSP